MPAARSPLKPVGGTRGCPSRDRPIDLVHLSRQTLGDQALEQEVLGLMDRQIVAFTGRLELATDDERHHIAHALKGAARNVGAFALANAAEAVELAPRNTEALAGFTTEMARTAAFIATLRN
jgi:HPt (histidine-containing phosphotransfer) domain-containing protein